MHFVIQLSDARGHPRLLAAEFDEGINPKEIAAKIETELVVSGTFDYNCNGCEYKGKDPKILEQLQKITGKSFKPWNPDVSLSFGGEYLWL